MATRPSVGLHQAQRIAAALDGLRPGQSVVVEGVTLTLPSSEGHYAPNPVEELPVGSVLTDCCRVGVDDSKARQAIWAENIYDQENQWRKEVGLQIGADDLVFEDYFIWLKDHPLAWETAKPCLDCGMFHLPDELLPLPRDMYRCIKCKYLHDTREQASMCCAEFITE